MTDTALRIANAGYLTRSLIAVAQDVTVTMVDCKTKQNIVWTKEESDMDGNDLIERVVGRFAAVDIVPKGKRKPVVKKGEIISQEKADILKETEVTEIVIRSVLTCEAPMGICQKCYGLGPHFSGPVELGTAVGIIAAQSIGEPGTQLTMRTFHIGGIAQGGQQSFQEASHEGTVTFRGENIIVNADGDQIVMARNMELLLIGENDVEMASFKMGYGSRLLVKGGQAVQRGDTLYVWAP